MKYAKSYIIWMPKNGTGKSRQIIISPGYLLALSIVLIMCVLSIPFFQNHIMGLNNKITQLEKNRLMLKSEISNLKYLKQNLTRIENKDRQLSQYFGIDNRSDTIEDLLGRGGLSDMYGESVEDVPVEGNLPAHLRDLESNLINFEKLLKTKETIQAFTPNIIPLDKKRIRISSGFGWRENPFTKKKEFHAAIDISGNWGTKIIAPANGIVLKTGHDKRLGNYIVLEHSEQIKTIYGHLSRILVKVGAEVSRGDKIGLMGNTGLSTSTHLHYMVVKNDRAVNPLEYILNVNGNI